MRNIFDKSLMLMEIEARHKAGYQNTILCCGDMNDGKTKFMLLIYFLIHKVILKEDKITIQPYFEVLEFAKNIDKLESKGIFFDEAGSGGLDVRKWNSVDNKLLSYILQTQRIKKNFYYIILPHKRLITHTHLVLFDYYIIVKAFIEDDIVKRYAHIYKINTRHMATNDYEDYISFVLLERFEIPNYNEYEELKEFQEFIKEYEKIELKRKQEIAQQIKKEAMQIIKDRETKTYKPKNRFIDEY